MPTGFWRDLPCGHPPDPVAAYTQDGHLTCHCGGGINPDDAFTYQWLDEPTLCSVHEAGACPQSCPHAHAEPLTINICLCTRCGCHVRIP